MARLDRLGPAKEVAQIGAAIGREFSHALLAAVVRKPEAELASALDRLIQSGLLFRQGVPPHATYLFKHALVQDAAYSTLLRSRRQQLHARIAATMEDQFPEIVKAQPEVLARHCAEAGSLEKAIGYWLKAGQQAIARWAMTEAVAQLPEGPRLAFWHARRRCASGAGARSADQTRTRAICDKGIRRAGVWRGIRSRASALRTIKPAAEL